jgi:hypothetical protein
MNKHTFDSLNKPQAQQFAHDLVTQAFELETLATGLKAKASRLRMLAREWQEAADRLAAPQQPY